MSLLPPETKDELAWIAKEAAGDAFHINIISSIGTLAKAMLELDEAVEAILGGRK